MLLARQCQNGALARYPNAVHELATFAFASSTFMLFNASLIFVPQMANILARSPRAKRISLRFTFAVCVTLTVPLALIALTSPGNLLLKLAFDIEGDTLAAVVRYLHYLLPLVMINGMRQYYTGLLVQVKRTGWVTVLTVLYLATVIAVLLLGFNVGWGTVKTLALAQVAGGLLHLAASFLLQRRFFHLPEAAEHEDLTYREAFAFFWPVAMTSTMFALSRPILYSFISRLPDGEPVIAALRVTFDFAMIFHSPVNQFRNLFVTFGQSDLAGLRRFMIRVLIGLTVIMALIAGSPVSDLFFHKLLGIEGQVLEMAQKVLWVLCLVPLVVGVRNYFHGLSLIRRRTRGMAIGAVCRNLTIYLVTWWFFEWGWLDHIAAASILLLGFVVETAIMFVLRNSNANET